MRDGTWAGREGSRLRGEGQAALVSVGVVPGRGRPGRRPVDTVEGNLRRAAR